MNPRIQTGYQGHTGSGNTPPIIHLEDRQYHSGNLRILYNGFPADWIPGRFARELTDRVAQAAVARFPNERIHVVEMNWAKPEAIADFILSNPVDRVIICRFVDPAYTEPVVKQLEAAGVKVHLIGQFSLGEHISFDFTGPLLGSEFKPYIFEELLPTQLNHLYLSYNRKPKYYRVNLINTLEDRNLIDRGVVTLGGWDGQTRYKLDEDLEELSRWGLTHVKYDMGLPFNPYSLGRLDIWQQSFINIVGECCDPKEALFVSEKTFKPIIGMRPFIINGCVAVYECLRKAGFDVFEDLFPVRELENNPDKSYDIIADAIETYAHYSSDQLHTLYATILPRLNKNRARFFEYADEQIPNLFDAIQSLKE